MCLSDNLGGKGTVCFDTAGFSFELDVLTARLKIVESAAEFALLGANAADELEDHQGCRGDADDANAVQ
jgi:hypothetical protein